MDVCMDRELEEETVAQGLEDEGGEI